APMSPGGASLSRSGRLPKGVTRALGCTAQTLPNRSSQRLRLLPSGDTTTLGLELGLGQEPEASLAPSEIHTDVQQCIGTSARAGKFHHRQDTIGLAGDQGHGLARDMVRGDIDA